MIEKVSGYLVNGRFYEKIIDAEKTERECKILELLQGLSISQIVEKLASDKDLREKMISVLGGN
jgi:hypothetical protein